MFLLKKNERDIAQMWTYLWNIIGD